MRKFKSIPLLALFFLLITVSVYAAVLPGIPEFIDEMVSKHQFKHDELVDVFAHAQHRPSIIEAISRPATAKPWLDYRAAFVNKKRVQLGLEFWDKYHATLHRAEKQFGVPAEIIVSIIGVETIYGRHAGTFRTLDALTTLAFDYPRRADFFRSELENYLLLAREQDFDLLSIRGSYAGALGVPQFMPSSYRKYAIDFNGNKTIDLLREDRDAIGSVANYMSSYGWKSGEPVVLRAQVSDAQCLGVIKEARRLNEWQQTGVTIKESLSGEMPLRLMDFTVADGKEFWLALNNFEVITRYNNSDFYAMTVFQLAEEIKQARQLNAKR